MTCTTGECRGAGSRGARAHSRRVDPQRLLEHERRAYSGLLSGPVPLVALTDQQSP